MKPLLLLNTILLVLSTCTRNDRLSELESAPVKTEVQQMLSAMSDSIHARGLAGWIPFLHRSPEFSWEFHGVQTSYDSLISAEQRESPQFQSITLAWDSIQVQPSASDKATFSATYQEIVVDTAGNQSILTGSVEAIVIKISGSWKVLRGRTFNENRRDND